MQRRAYLILALVTLYFGIALVPHWRPATGQGLPPLVYLISLPFVLLLLGAAALVAAWLWFRRRTDPSSRFIRPLLVVSLGGLAAFAAVRTASSFISRDLPTGSYVRPFASSVWKDEGSAAYVKGDITPRQKMLGDVVRNVLPGRSRGEIEQLLGPSLDTSSFHGSADLVYLTGPEREALFAIESEFLVIRLDERGRFKRYQITPH